MANRPPLIFQALWALCKLTGKETGGRRKEEAGWLFSGECLLHKTILGINEDSAY